MENKEMELVKTEESRELDIFSSKNFESFTTLNLEKKENKIDLYNALQQCDVRINDIKNQEIEIKNMYIEKKEIAERNDKGEIIYNEETGEVKTKVHFRIILFGNDGKTYVSSAYGVYNSLRQIVSIFGSPSEENIIKVKVSTRPTKVTGHENLVLVVVA